MLGGGFCRGGFLFHHWPVASESSCANSFPNNSAESGSSAKELPIGNVAKQQQAIATSLCQVQDVRMRFIVWLLQRFSIRENPARTQPRSAHHYCQCRATETICQRLLHRDLRRTLGG